MKTIYLAVILYFLPHLAYGQSAEWKAFPVPGAIETKQHGESVSAEWKVSTSNVHNRLAGVTVYDGRPEEMVSLVPDSEEQVGKHNAIATWKFEKPPTGNFWIELSYCSTSIVLSQSLPKDIRELRITYNTLVNVCGLPEIVRIEYR